MSLLGWSEMPIISQRRYRRGRWDGLPA